MATGNGHSFSGSCFLLLLLSFRPYFAISQSRVKAIPGFAGPLPFNLETGYVGVGELEEEQLFYYFIESERNPKEDPLLLWLTGGPGCSTWSALAYEIGPLNFVYQKYDGNLPTLVLNPHSWTKVASIIFVDSPVWTGFSYSKGPRDSKSGDFKSSKKLNEFLRKWLISHPQFHQNPIYIGGDSYSGLILPIVVQEIVNGNEVGQDPILNLKGYLLGNPLTDYEIDSNSMIPFMHGMAIISDEMYESFIKNCNGEYYIPPTNPQCENLIEAIEECLARIQLTQILEPQCSFASPLQERRSLQEKSTLFEPPMPFTPPMTFPPFGCRTYGYLLSFYYANSDIVREALHIRKGTISKWIRCNNEIPYIPDMKSTVLYHLNLSVQGYRSLIYSGDHDLKVTFRGTQTWIRSLNLTIVDDWRPWFVDDQVAGYTRTYANLTFATVKGAGHAAPEYKPKECLAMFSRRHFQVTINKDSAATLIWR